MGLRTLDKGFIGALICGTIALSVAVGFCVYHVAVSIFEIAAVLTNEMLLVGSSGEECHAFQITF